MYKPVELNKMQTLPLTDSDFFYELPLPNCAFIIRYNQSSAVVQVTQVGPALHFEFKNTSLSQPHADYDLKKITGYVLTRLASRLMKRLQCYEKTPEKR